MSRSRGTNVITRWRRGEGERLRQDAEEQITRLWKCEWVRGACVVSKQDTGAYYRVLQLHSNINTAGNKIMTIGGSNLDRRRNYRRLSLWTAIRCFNSPIHYKPNRKLASKLSATGPCYALPVLVFACPTISAVQFVLDQDERL